MISLNCEQLLAWNQLMYLYIIVLYIAFCSDIYNRPKKSTPKFKTHWHRKCLWSLLSFCLLYCSYYVFLRSCGVSPLIYLVCLMGGFRGNLPGIGQLGEFVFLFFCFYGIYSCFPFPFSLCFSVLPSVFRVAAFYFLLETASINDFTLDLKDSGESFLKSSSCSIKTMTF